jgi:hypothetical protein
MIKSPFRTSLPGTKLNESSDHSTLRAGAGQPNMQARSSDSELVDRPDSAVPHICWICLKDKVRETRQLIKGNIERRVPGILVSEN